MIGAKSGAWVAAIVVALAAWAAVEAREAGGGIQMPDPRQMSGIPLPVGDMPAGTVTVRVVKGSLSNAVSDHPVELRVGGKTVTATTDGNGRATFQNLAPGSQAKAFAQVAGEKLESQEFEIPAAGGIRVMLVAADPEAGAPPSSAPSAMAGPAQPGTVVLGDQSRFVVELSDDSLSVFNILQILNTARTPVQPAQSVVFELPDGAEGTAILEGSSPQATVEGKSVVVAGPFAPGNTLVQFAYSMPYSGDRVTIEQPLPVALTRVAVLAQKVGDMQVASPQFAGHREMNAEGQTYIVAQGPGVAAGETLAVRFTGLPHPPTWPRNIALVAAILILAAGAWSSARGVRGTAAVDGRRTKLHQRRDKLFDELAVLEEQHRTGRVASGHYASRRRDLVAALERVYGEIDEEATA
jgi:hypothetical protein